LSRRESEASYAALIRWRGPDPTIEIETRHPGFATAEEAALFANALAPAAPIGLRLRPDQSIHLLLADDRVVRLADGKVVLWHLQPQAPHPSRQPDDPSRLLVANDTDFTPLPWGEIQLIPAAHGDYEPAQYGVRGPDGTPVDVLIDWDEEHHLRVTAGADAPPVEPLPAFFLGSLPSA
jgi:hypothetical protein